MLIHTYQVINLSIQHKQNLNDSSKNTKIEVPNLTELPSDQTIVTSPTENIPENVDAELPRDPIDTAQIDSSSTQPEHTSDSSDIPTNIVETTDELKTVMVHGSFNTR